MATAVIDEEAAQTLKAGLRGEVILPDDEGYETARRVWNGLIDRRPALIARCAGAADVLDAVRFAHANDLVVAVRGGGHNLGGFGTCDGGIVIDLSLMKGIRVDPRSRVVRAEGGVKWGELDHETQAFGLATTGGLVSTTGIAGLTLGGGSGWLSRKHGFSCDNLLSADVATADGRLLTASHDENDDLFWGLRGGGGNFGIVTSFEYRVHPVGPMILGGAVFYPVEQAMDFLRFYREWTPTLPDEVGTDAAFLTAPEAPFIPEHLQGTPMIGLALCYSGPLEGGEEAIKGLREFGPPAIDLVGPMPYTALQGMFDPFFPHGICSYWKTEYVDDLSDGAIETIISHVAKAPSALPQLHIEHQRGAVARVGRDETAFSHRDAGYRVLAVALWTDPAETEMQVEWAREGSRAIKPFSTGGVYLNFLGEEGEDRVRAAYRPETYARLAALKAKYDPTNFFRLNQNIKPA